jgi:LysM repeat protein
LALIAVLIAFMAIITSSGGGGSNSSGTSSSTTPAANTSKTSSKTAARRAHHHSRYYTVHAGDTLGGIASKTGVSLDTIQSLNPSVDPSAMTTGQKIRIR